MYDQEILTARSTVLHYINYFVFESNLYMADVFTITVVYEA
jgi:hypothetical protein